MDLLSNLFYNADNEWYQSTVPGITNPNTVNWDAAGNMLGNNDFGGGPNPQTITYNAKNQLASITDTQQNVIPMTYTGAGQAERVSAGWVATNPLTPNGSATYTYGSGLLSNTDSLGTTHYTRDALGTLVAQRVPGTTTNYYYLFDGLGSVIKMVDASGNVVATYAYCPTGNDAEPSLGLAAPGNPYQFLGMYQDTATKMYYDAYGYTDSNSGNGTQLCLVPILGGLPFCLPSQTQITVPAFLPCPGEGNGVGNGVSGFADYQWVAGPEASNLGCHVNVVSGNLNQHITNDAQDQTFWSDQIIGAIGTNPLQAAIFDATYAANYIVNHGGTQNFNYYYDFYMNVGNLAGRLASLALYMP